MSVSQRVAIAVFRKDPFVLTFRVQGYDLTGATMRFAVGQDPDSPGGPLIEIANTATRGAEGVRMVATGTTDSIVWSDIEIIIDKATIATLPPAAELGADLTLFYDFEWQRVDLGSGFSQEEETILFGDFIVRGSVNND